MSSRASTHASKYALLERTVALPPHSRALRPPGAPFPPWTVSRAQARSPLSAVGVLLHRPVSRGLGVALVSRHSPTSQGAFGTRETAKKWSRRSPAAVASALCSVDARFRQTGGTAGQTIARQRIFSAHQETTNKLVHALRPDNPDVIRSEVRPTCTQDGSLLVHEPKGVFPFRA